MATKLKNTFKIPAGAKIIGSAEVVTTTATAQSLADHGATVPSFTTFIMVIPLSSGALHWHPRGTPSTTFGHAIAAFEPFGLEHDQLAAPIMPDAGTPDLMLVYFGYKRF